jgi:hypothetical protein
MGAWTPEEDAAIRARARTHSATQIAALLPGRSRASVIGRAWRLGASLAKDAATRLELEHPRRRARVRLAPPIPPAADADAWPSASPAARRAALAVRPRLLRLEEVPARGCRWPYGDGDVRFCGGRAGEGSAYCPAHRGVAYVPDASGYDPEALVAIIDRREARKAPTPA